MCIPVPLILDLKSLSFHLELELLESIQTINLLPSLPHIICIIMSPLDFLLKLFIIFLFNLHSHTVQSTRDISPHPTSSPVAHPTAPSESNSIASQPPINVVNDDHDHGTALGIYSGSISVKHDNDGRALLMISKMESDIDRQRSASLSHIPSSRSSARLMMLDAEYQRFTFFFFYGVHDPKSGRIELSNRNFSFDAVHQNRSFLPDNSSESDHIQCAQSLSLWFDGDAVSGSATGCRLNSTFSDFVFLDRDRFVHRAHWYSATAMLVGALSFVAVLKQYEESTSKGIMNRISFWTVYAQWIYQGVVCWIHFNVAVNFEITSFMMAALLSILSANLYSKMMRKIWTVRYGANDVNYRKMYSFLKVLAMVSTKEIFENVSSFNIFENAKKLQVFKCHLVSGHGVCGGARGGPVPDGRTVRGVDLLVSDRRTVAVSDSAEYQKRTHLFVEMECDGSRQCIESVLSILSVRMSSESASKRDELPIYSRFGHWNDGGNSGHFIL